jgi:hypothetical protein
MSKKVHGRRRNEVLEINALGSAELMIKEIVYMAKTKHNQYLKHELWQAI